MELGKSYGAVVQSEVEHLLFHRDAGGQVPFLQYTFFIFRPAPSWNKTGRKAQGLMGTAAALALALLCSHWHFHLVIVEKKILLQGNLWEIAQSYLFGFQVFFT